MTYRLNTREIPDEDHRPDTPHKGIGLFARDQAAERDLTGEVRRWVFQDRVSNRGAGAVGGDEKLGFKRTAVGEADDYSLIVLIEPRKAFAGDHTLGIGAEQSFQKDGMQVRAMNMAWLFPPHIFPDSRSEIAGQQRPRTKMHEGYFRNRMRRGKDFAL